jgi:hypothetical protein
MVDHGADIQAKDHRGRTVLHHAAWRGNLEATKLVVALGATEDLLAKDADGKTPLQLAAEEDATKAVEFLSGFMESCGISVEKPRQGVNKQRTSSNVTRPRPRSVPRGLSGYVGSAARTADRIGWKGVVVVLVLSHFCIFAWLLRG